MQNETIPNNYIEDESITWTEIEKGIVRKIMAYNEDLMMVKVRFDAKAIGSLHQHIHTQMTFIESGVFEVFVGDEKKILRKGDVFHIPSNMMHGVACIEEGILIDVFNPMRKDFI